MFKNKKITALVPARGGSKGVFRKNIKPLAGMPLIAWTIVEAGKSRYIDDLIVSTDDKQIAEMAARYGAEAPFIRPRRLASDTAKGIDVVLHALKWLGKNNKGCHDILVLLQPTSPLRTAEDIDRAIEYLFRKKAKAVVSVCKTGHPPYWMNTLPKNGSMKDFIRPEFRDKNRQQAPNFYILNGAVYLGYSEYIKKQNGFMGDETFAYVMPKERSVDIDDDLDFRFSGFLIKDKGSQTKGGS